jgi:hypothetical protein
MFLQFSNTISQRQDTHSSEQILKIEVNLNLFQLKQKLNSLILGKIEVKE